MNKERPIDIKRKSGGVAKIGTTEDGAICGMIEIKGKIFMIKEKTVYEFTLADKIDPSREHPNLPLNTQQIALNIGSNSEIFSRTLLTAKLLFNTDFLDETVDVDQALFLVFEAVKELEVMNNEIEDILLLEKSAVDQYENRNSNHAIPSVNNVETRCKTIFQKIDHIQQTLIELIRIFFPDFISIKKKFKYEDFHQFIKKCYGEKDIFAKLITAILPSIKLMREIRNCLDHRNSEITIKDFELQANSELIPPTIEVHNNGIDLDRTTLSTYLPIAREDLLIIYEEVMANLCSKRIRKNSTLPYQVLFIPEDRRKNKYTKYSYWSPIGNGGYFHQ